MCSKAAQLPSLPEERDNSSSRKGRKSNKERKDEKKERTVEGVHPQTLLPLYHLVCSHPKSKMLVWRKEKRKEKKEVLCFMVTVMNSFLLLALTIHTHTFSVLCQYLLSRSIECLQ